MCAAVNSLDANKTTANSTVKGAPTKKKSKTFLCCTPCCFGGGPGLKTTNGTNDYNGAAKPRNSRSLTSEEEPGEGDSAKKNKNNPFLDNAENGSADSSAHSVQIDDVSKLKTAPNSASFPSRQLVYSPESPSTSSCPPLSPQRPHPAPAKLGFLVSFLVDARGGAMKGNRGSGMRLIIPPGAVDHPTRVTCRYLRGTGDRLPFPPPLMERESLASRVIEMGPLTSTFKVPVLLEVPHFASVRGGERELIVLRCDDGETWREHTTSYLQTGWQGDDEEIYADFVATTGLTAAYEELDTSRVVRISCTGFPQYFAILSRIKEEVRAIGADGGRVTSSHEPHVQAYFPKGALQKKIKVALQVQKVPLKLLKLTCPTAALKFSPLVAIEPRRRRFHNAVQVALPLSAATSKDSTRVRLLCSLAASSTPKAVFEDVTDITPITISKGSVIFETKVSALFWAVYLEEPSVESMTELLPSAQYLYEEIMLTPYMARFVVLHKPHCPHAWCDTLRIICVTDDKAESWGELGNPSWTTVASTDEMEVTCGSTLTCHVEGGLEVATDCQLEFGHRTSLVFQPFVSNFATLLVRPRKSHPEANRGHLIIKKAFGHIEECQQLSLTTMNLDLRDPLEISSLPDLKVDLDEINEDDVDDNEDVVVVNIEDNVQDEERIYEDVPNNCENTKNVIAVKEYSPESVVTETDTDQADLVFIHVNGTVATS